MKRGTTILILFLMSWKVFGQMAIYDRAIEAQQERMVFKRWDPDKFFPKEVRVFGVPTNPNWYLTWALHPNYPHLDRRPLSATGEQTQRLALAAAMNISSNYYKQESDSVRLIATKEMGRISGALSESDPIYLLYYKKELKPLEEIEATAFKHVPPNVQDYLDEIGAFAWYLENMRGLAERYQFALTLDMERGQRFLMYHRILLEMRKVIQKWEQKISLSQQVMAFPVSTNGRRMKEGIFGQRKENDPEKIINQIIEKRAVLK